MRSYILLALTLGACHPKPVQEASPAHVVADAPLRNTRWVARELAGQPVAVADNMAEPYLLLRPAGAAEGNAGCNRFRADAIAEGANGLRFSPLLLTRLACPAMATETAFSQLLAQTQRYRISGDTLRLYGSGDAVLARLEAVYLQ